MHLNRITRRLSYSNVIASLALFIALGGASYAAVSIPANSVGTPQLKKSAVTGSKIKRNAVSAAKVKDGSLQRRDFASGALLQGPPGTMGAQGPKGDPGQKGEAGRSALEPLQSGETIRGLVGGDFEGAAGGDFGVLETFAIPAPQPVGDQNVIIDGGEGDGADRCTGAVGAPSAPAGAVCVYISSMSNVTGAEGAEAIQSGGSQLGFKLYWHAPAAGDTLLLASWAYQAP